MNILLAAAELTPIAKAGGLADVAAVLPIEWKKKGHNPIIIMPKYSSIDVNKYKFEPTDMVLFVPISTWVEFARLWKGTLPETDIPVYLIENNDYFYRDGIYGYPNEYLDNDRRFIFFSRAIFEAAKAIDFHPDIIHAHDFHTAFTMPFLKTHYREDPRFNRTAGVYTIHNLAYQGWFNPERAMEFAGYGFDAFFKGSWFEKNDSVNAMKAGIMFADKITTVSPTYSKEIRWDYYGEGMQEILTQKGGDLIGILNGVHYDEWNPATDEFIYQKYDASNLHLKAINKLQFLKEKGINGDESVEMPLIGMVSRLAEQKGIDLLMNKLEYHLFNSEFRFAILGSGEQRYVEYFNYLAWKYPNRISVFIGYDNELAHKLIAASDFLMLPSRFEPCGLTQMYALKYGTVPIVRSTGGLADTVYEFVPRYKKGNGFLFINYNSEDMEFALTRALQIYGSQENWDLVRKNAMGYEFSSTVTADNYLQVFHWALEKVR
jgi:starch synthase